MRGVLTKLASNESKHPNHANRPKVYANIVAYEPDRGLLQDLVKSIGAQVDHVVIVNNSPQKPVSFGSEVTVIDSPMNVGIAAAQNVAATISIENGAEFLIQLDQDTKVPENLVQALLASYCRMTETGARVGVVGPRWLDDDSGTEKIGIRKRMSRDHSGCRISLSVISSGSLISTEAFREAGGFYGDLFIDYVDDEFCFRLRSLGYRIVQDDSVSMRHSVGREYCLLGGKLRVRGHAPYRLYYLFRNLIYLQRRPYVPASWKLSTFSRIPGRVFLNCVLLPERSKRLRYIARGTMDGMFSRLGPLESRRSGCLGRGEQE